MCPSQVAQVCHCWRCCSARRAFGFNQTHSGVHLSSFPCLLNCAQLHTGQQKFHQLLKYSLPVTMYSSYRQLVQKMMSESVPLISYTFLHLCSYSRLALNEEYSLKHLCTVLVEIKKSKLALATSLPHSLWQFLTVTEPRLSPKIFTIY